jgi:REP element-mobilizing transposase RayT
MPDHVHASVESESDRADFQAFVKLFKQTTGFAYRKDTRRFLWQPGYHERVLRSDEATDVVIRYILENPIRAGLSTAVGEYGFAGSGEYTIDELRAA